MTVNAPISIMNIALVLLGQREGTAPSEQTKSMQFANGRYESIRDIVLTQGRWNCATTRAVLAVSSTAPLFGFSRQYPLPNDFMRFIGFEEGSFEIPYKIEALSDGSGGSTRMLLTDEMEANIKYVFRLTEVAKMDELLKYAIGARLAQEIALAVKGDLQQSGYFKSLSDEAISLAHFIEADQAAVEVMSGPLWLNSRIAGSGSAFRSIQDVTS